MEKYVFGKASLSNLVGGLLLIFFAIAFITYLFGVQFALPETGMVERAVVKEGVFVFLLVSLFTMALGVYGGYHIGRYVEMKFTERRIQKKSGQGNK